jgi:hypothetical protein
MVDSEEGDCKKMIDHNRECEDLWTKERLSNPLHDRWAMFSVCVDAYGSLRVVLEEAFKRASCGKGKERHARGKEKFEDQWILRGARIYGSGGLYFQINKKLEESFKMSGEQRVNELLDCINYCAAAIILEREQREKQ